MRGENPLYRVYFTSACISLIVNYTSSMSNLIPANMQKMQQSALQEIGEISNLRPDTIEQKLRTFESFGIHRTGSKADDLTSEWLAEELKDLGIESSIDTYQFPLFEYREAHLQVGETRIKGIPMFDGGSTAPRGISGVLTDEPEEDLMGKILVATSAMRGDSRWTNPHSKDHYQEFARRGAVGIIVPSSDPDGHIVLRNAEYIRSPFQLPVLQVTNRDITALRQHLILGEEATLIINASLLSSTATNVFADIGQPSTDSHTIGIMTPKSGWFTCAAERGGGIACWLAIAEAMTKWDTRPVSIHFSATGGHELGHQGLLHHLRNIPKGTESPMQNPAGTWLHLGASIGAKHTDIMRGPQAEENSAIGPRFSASSSTLYELGENALDQSGIRPEYYFPEPVGTPVSGEARDIESRGGHFISFRGGHHYFHSPQDTVDVAVDPIKISQWGTAAVLAAIGLTTYREGGDS